MLYYYYPMLFHACQEIIHITKYMDTSTLSKYYSEYNFCNNLLQF